MSGGTYQPFRGLSAWFSSSIPLVVIQQWDYYGGIKTDEKQADYLFSDDSQELDTIRVYETQSGIVVVQSSWILEILQCRCPVYDIPLGQHLLQPHHLNPQDTKTIPPRAPKVRPQETYSSIVSSTTRAKRPDIGESISNKTEGLHPPNVNPPQKNVSVTYGGIWEALEARVMTENIGEITHLDNVKVNKSSDVALKVCDFVCTRPGFKVQRID